MSVHVLNIVDDDDDENVVHEYQEPQVKFL